MRLLIQRVRQARVESEGRLLAETGAGLLILAGFGASDGPDLPCSRLWRALCDKVLDLRIFPDAEERLNLSLRDTGGDLLLVSQFTLYADCRKGRRPSFTGAAEPGLARTLYDALLRDFGERAPARVGSGEFGAMMDVSFTNWGPVTILLDSAEMGGGA